MTDTPDICLPRGKIHIDAEALDRMRFDPNGCRDGHDMTGVNWNTAWRMVATIDTQAAHIARLTSDLTEHQRVCCEYMCEHVDGKPYGHTSICDRARATLEALRSEKGGV